MSSAWMIVSPSMVSAGPGGCLVDVTTAWKRSRVSAGEPPRSVAMSFACNRVRLNPDTASRGKNVAGVILAVAVMWATTSRTVQSWLSVFVDHWSSPSPPRSAARARRSEWTVGQMSVFAMALSSSGPSRLYGKLVVGVGAAHQWKRRRVEMIIRDEHPSEADVVDALVGDAFGGRVNEVELVRGLRAGVPPARSRVAVEDGTLVGHAMLSAIGLEGTDASVLGLGPVLGLAPVSVAPSSQG